MPEKDITEKYLESYNDVFADIVNVLLFNGQRRVLSDDLRDTKARTLYKADGKLREQERDVSTCASAPAFFQFSPCRGDIPKPARIKSVQKIQD